MERKISRYNILLRLQDKIELIGILGIDYLFIVRFTSAFANLDPEQFACDYLAELNVRHVIAGFDYYVRKIWKRNDGNTYQIMHKEVSTLRQLLKLEDKRSKSQFYRD